MSSKQKNEPIHFQAVSWSAKDIELEDSDDEDDYTSNKQYTITIFGRSFDGKSVCVKTAFNPFFYIEVPNNWKHSNALFLVKELRKKLGKRYGSHLLEYSLQKSKKFFGFTNHEEFNFLKVTFKSKIAWQYCGKTLKKPVYVLGKMERFNTYESNLDPMIRFAHIQEIPFSCSICLDTYSVVPDDDERYSNCDIEVTAKWNTIKLSEEYDMIAPIVQASFDIETYSPDGSFPDPRNPKCPVLQIANTYQVYGQETIEKQLFCVGECEPIEGADIIECEDERELLNRWALEVNRRQIDTITGYNIWKFDLEYMYVRAEYSGAHDFMNIGKVRDYTATLRDASFSSSAYGDNHYKMVDTPGILQIDLLVIMQREHKLVSYKLDNVAEHFLGERKVDLPYQVMFEKIVGTPADKREVGVYCIQDTELPQKLINKLAIIPNMVEMSKATWVPLSFLVERGQGIKVFSQLTYQTRLENMLVINLDKEEIKNDDYEGATVLAAKKGAYMEIPITGLDFASLYPTIMRAHNLDHSTLVMDPKYDNLEGVEYFQVNNHRFAQNHEGIIPKMLKLLAQNRKKAKKEMAKAEERGDTFAKALYNGKQLAFKVSMNSMYGFCGANVGMLPCKPVAESTTCVGRNMIEKTKNLVEEWYPGSDVVYGDTDSVMVRFNVGKLRGKDAIQKCFELGNEAADRISDTFKKPIELEFEKVYFPYLLYSKKRYAGLMYTKPEKPDYIDAKGIQLVRRDNPPFVKDISQRVLDRIMYDMDVYGAMDLVRDVARTLLDNKIDVKDLVVSKSMKDNYKNRNQPHLAVAQKIEERAPGSGPKSGERVPYVFIDTGNKKHKQFEKAEDPEYAIEKKLPLDLMYYFEHSLSSPITSLFEVFIENTQNELFGEIIREYVNNKNKQRKLNDFFK